MKLIIQLAKAMGEDLHDACKEHGRESKTAADIRMASRVIFQTLRTHQSIEYASNFNRHYKEGYDTKAAKG